MASKSSEFLRLEKNIGDGYKSVYEFHTVVNGNMYYREHEEKDGEVRWIGESKPVFSKDVGNKFYISLRNNGYELEGKYEMDTLGHKSKITSK